VWCGKAVTKKNTAVIELLNRLMREDTAGDPVSHRRWSRKDTRSISGEFAAEGVQICPTSVGKLLKGQGYSLRVNRKRIAETHHPDRNRQFEIIALTKKRFEDAGQPIVSVDTKKKELVGNFANPGKTWRRESQDVLAHDFRSQASAIAAPYGLYETILNLGTVVIGMSADTAEFAVDCIDLWLTEFGWKRYSGMKEMLVLCDSGGSNSCRCRLWKYSLYEKISRVYGINVEVCHYPSGASKWNPVEHRLFSFISNEWAGQPLRSFEIMLEHIKSTVTTTGLKVAAFLNEKQYMKDIKISDKQMDTIGLKRNDELPQWNYTISPKGNS